MDPKGSLRTIYPVDKVRLRIVAPQYGLRPGESALDRLTREWEKQVRHIRGSIELSPAHLDALYDLDLELLPEKPRKPAQDGDAGNVVYFLQPETGGLIKIGASTVGGAKSRVAAFTVGSPETLVIRRVVFGYGDRTLEHALHVYFAEARLRNEWFQPTPELVRVAHAL